MSLNDVRYTHTHDRPGTWSGLYKAGAKIYKENGVRGLLQGHSATLLRIFPYAAIKYMAYDQVESVCYLRCEFALGIERHHADFDANEGITNKFSPVLSWCCLG